MNLQLSTSIVAQNSESQEIQKYPIQINRLINVREKGKYSKETLEKLNILENWQTIDVSVEELADIISSGVSVRPGIKVDGNKKEHVTECHWLFVDFDDKDYRIVDTFDTDLFLNHGAFIYKTPSYTDDHQKHRAVFRLSRSVTPLEYELIYEQYIFEHYPKADKSCKDVGRFFYGSKEQTEPLHNRIDRCLDVDEILSECKEKKAKETLGNGSSTTATGLTFTEEFLQYIHDEVFAKPFEIRDEAFIIRFGCDPFEFGTQHYIYCAHNKRTPEKGETYRFETHNVFNPEPYIEQGGDKLVVCYTEGKLPFFLDHTIRTETVTGRECATFLDYFLAWRTREDESFARQFYDCREENGKFKPGILTRLMNEICEFYRIPRYVPPSSNSIINEVLDSFKDKLYIKNGSMSKNVCELFVFDTKEKRYLTTDNVSFAHHQFQSEVMKQCPHILEIINHESVLRNKNNPDQRKRREITSLGYHLESNWVKDYRFSERFEHIDSFYPDDRYIPIDDYLLDVFTKETLVNDGLADNTIKPYKNIPLTGVSDDDPDIQLFKRFFHNWTKCDVKGQLLLDWFILNCCRTAHTTRHALCLIGNTKVGKSSYAKLLISVMNQELEKNKPIDELANKRGRKKKKQDAKSIASEVSCKTFFNSDSHKGELLQNYRMVFIDEVKGISQDQLVADLKENVQDSDRGGTINPKGRKAYRTKFFYSLTLAFEENMKIPTDPGFDGRVIYLKLNKVYKDVEAYTRLLNLEVIRKILAWCLMQPVDKVMGEFKELAKHKVFIDALREEKEEKEYVYRWLISGRVAFTHNYDDKVSFLELKESFDRYYKDQNGGSKDLFSCARAFNSELKSTLKNEPLWDKHLVDFG